jgi:starch phosphorylase
VHRRRKRRLIAFIRARQVASAVRRKAPAAEVQRAADVLDPNALTIGFARRFATYKRATLIFRDIERLKKILCNKEMPVQIVVAGKAHPRDHPGKALIREIVQFSRDPELWKHLVFVEDYDMKVARELVQGVDLWLNNPKRGQEACGTSGMKAGLNGVLNLSILDGWYDEAYEYSGGWAIGDREEYHEEQDPIHASALYYLLENEIVPTFYERREGGVPAEWIRRVKQSLIHLSPQFDSRRMVSEYETELYAPAHESFVRLWKGNLEGARERARWNARIAEVWDRVRFLDGGAAPAVPVSSGMAIQIRAALDLAGLSPDDVRVEAVLGQVGSSGFLEGTEVVSLPCTENGGAAAVFSKQVISDRTGRVGYAVRVSANHCQDPLTRPCSAFLKWCG